VGRLDIEEEKTVDHSAAPGRVAFLRTANENLRRPETLAPVAHSRLPEDRCRPLVEHPICRPIRAMARDVTYLRFVPASRRIRT